MRSIVSLCDVGCVYLLCWLQAVRDGFASHGEGDLGSGSEAVTGMEQWECLGDGLHTLGFKVPTPVQKKGIAMTMKRSGDIIGAAETVSKTECWAATVKPAHVRLGQEKVVFE